MNGKVGNKADECAFIRFGDGFERKENVNHAITVQTLSHDSLEGLFSRPE